MSPTTNIFKALPGQWQVNRSIEDQHATLQASGIATFKHDAAFPHLLRYHEIMQLQLAQGEMIKSEQAYLYGCDGKEIQVYFNETPIRLFHSLSFGEEQDASGPLSASAMHFCNPDHYEVGYVIFDANHFAIRYKVRGPKKDYVSQSELWRLG